MSRLKRMYYERAVYHVYFRGNNKQMVLKGKLNKIDLLMTLKKFQERKGFKIYGFVIMDNHAHMVIEVGEAHNISKVMQSVLLSYSQKFRRRTGYVGYVWQGRFESKPIEDERYMLECLHYIHNNPVKANIVTEECEYLYSSARFYEGLKTKEINNILLEISRYGGTGLS